MSLHRVVLIDSKNMVYRHGAVNPHLSRSDGFPTGALYGCLNSMLGIARHLPNTSFVWVWDGDGETWRQKLTRENVLVQTNFLANAEYNARPRKHERRYGYKANRIRNEEVSESKYPQEGKARSDIQIPVLRLVLEGAGFRNFQIPNLEGDDLIAILTRHLLENTHAEVVIHSGDRDFYQLLKHKRVKILTSWARIQNGKPLFVDRNEVKEEYGVSVRNWVKYRAWTGDASDNIPHLKNVGGSAACKLLEAGFDPSLEFKDIATLSGLATLLGLGKLPKWEKLKRFFEPNGIERTWPFVQQNYKLCKLVSRPDDDRLPIKMRDILKHVLEHVEFTRDSKRVNADSYRRVSFLLMQYQLNSILSKRDVLWRIP